MDVIYAILTTLMDDLKSEKFGRWLFQQMEAKGWNMTDLATRAGVSKQVISKYINNPPENPDNNVLNGIARALQLPPETVLRAAGLLPPEPEYVPLLDEWTAVFYELTPDEQQELIDIARLKVDRRKSPGQQSNQKSPSRSKRPARSVLK